VDAVSAWLPLLARLEEVAAALGALVPVRPPLPYERGPGT